MTLSIITVKMLIGHVFALVMTKLAFFCEGARAVPDVIVLLGINAQHPVTDLHMQRSLS